MKSFKLFLLSLFLCNLAWADPEEKALSEIPTVTNEVVESLQKVSSVTSCETLDLPLPVRHDSFHQEYVWSLEKSGNLEKAQVEKIRLHKLLLEKPILTSRQAERHLMREMDVSSVEELFTSLMMRYYGKFPESSQEVEEAISEIGRKIPQSMKEAFELLMEGNRVHLRPEMQLVKFRDGTMGVFKPAPYQFKKEAAAYKIDQVFGFSFIPMTLEREVDGVPGSLQYFIQNAKVPSEEEAEKFEPLFFKKMRFYDYLTAHGDRSPRKRNFVLAFDGQLVGIDNDAIFSNGNVLTDPMVKDIEGNPLEHAPNSTILERMKSVPDEDVRNGLKSELSEEEILKLLKRRKLFLQKYEEVLSH